MTVKPRCEPPLELRDRDGWHWIAKDGAKPLALHWQPNRAGQDSEWGLGYFSRSAAYAAGFRYVAPVTPPATVAALVEALEECANDLEAYVNADNPHADQYPAMEERRQRDLAPVRAARSAIALYRGEAGR